jgi:hypothetical protein
MNGFKRLTGVAVAALLVTSTLAACSGDDEPVPGTEATGTNGQSGGSGGDGGGGTTGATGNGPDSAGDRDPDAPDNKISEKPGGPGESNGSQKNGGKKSGKNGGGSGSGGVTPPPQPSPAAQ